MSKRMTLGNRNYIIRPRKQVLKALLGALLGLLLNTPAHTQVSETEWNWYFAGFDSPLLGSEVMLRSGTASVKVTKTELYVRFSERAYPEMRGVFRGKIIGSGNVHGVLDNFFPSGGVTLTGLYQEKGKPSICHWREIILRPSVPDGRALLISQTSGPCQ